MKAIVQLLSFYESIEFLQFSVNFISSLGIDVSASLLLELTDLFWIARWADGPISMFEMLLFLTQLDGGVI